MKEIDDEDLQRLIEQQLNKIDSGYSLGTEDEELYKAVFTALSQEPPMPDHTPLANTVVAQLQAQQEQRDAVKYNLAIAAVIIGGILFTAAALVFINPAVISSIDSGLSVNKGIILFIVLSFALIQVLDKKLIHNKQRSASL